VSTLIGAAASRPPFPVTLNNWQSAEQIGWTFQHISEIFPTHDISRGTAPSVRLPFTPEDVDELTVSCADGRRSTVAQVMAATDTDGWMVLHHNKVIAEHYPEPRRPGSQMQPGTAHLLMSVSKSIVGTVVGCLVARGILDLHKPLQSYIPRLSGSGYEGATIRHLLDMRSGIRFSEDYLDPHSEVRVLEQAFGWAPHFPGVPETLRGFLLTLRRDRPHGGVFDYRSCETDVLGWVCEEATGRRFAELASALVWSKLGAEFDANIVVDVEGSGFFDGGISATMGDLARFGAMYTGRGRALTGLEVLPSSWVEDCLVGDTESRTAFAASPGDNRMPGGMYRNQFWLPYPDRPVLACLGIHGQMVYIDLAADVVAVKLSCWPAPQDAWKLFSTFSAFGAITSAVSAA
jgi:CubicO group peptidase (beta-lactamase class C family)